MSKFILFNADPLAHRNSRVFDESPNRDGSERKASLDDIMSEAAAGYQLGVSWNQPYRPDGPWCSQAPHLKERDALIARAWLSGFDVGLSENPNSAKLDPRVYRRITNV